MSPILLRPIREQFEHSRVIRLLQTRLRRRYLVEVNLGDESEAAGVRSGTSLLHPDLVLTSATGARRLHGVVEVETAESVNHLEAMAEWVHYGKIRGAFYLYVPAGATDVARRLCEHYGIAVTEIWSYQAVGDQMRFTMTFRSPRAASRAAAAARRTLKSGNGASKGPSQRAGTATRAVGSTTPTPKAATHAAGPRSNQSGGKKSVAKAARTTDRSSRSATKKMATTKAATKKTPTTKAATKKTATTKAATKKMATTKAATKKTATTKAATKKLATTKAATKKMATTKAATKKMATTKAATKKMATTKAATKKMATTKAATKKMATSGKRRASSDRRTSTGASTSAASSTPKTFKRSTGAGTEKTAAASSRSRKRR